MPVKYLCAVPQQVLTDFDKEYGTALKHATTLLAVSGGIDSMVLADLFLKGGFPFAIAHVNFGLRGRESEGDEKLVLRFAKKHAVPCYVFHPKTLEHAQQNGLSVQMAARELRYAFFKRCMEENGLKYLATAHHANDNLENFFIYLLRGNSKAALSGIAPKNDNLLRPLHKLSKEEILAYAEAHSLVWREDSSNAKQDYLRNKIRHSIVPGIAHFYPEVFQDFTALSKELRGHFEQRESQWQRLLNDFCATEAGGDTFVSKELLATSSGKAALEWYFRSKGFHKSMAEKISQPAKTGSTFRSASSTVFVEANGFRVKENNEIAAYNHTLTLSDLPCFLDAGLFSLEIKIIPANAAIMAADHWLFDADALRFPLQVRNRNSGDRMSPWGGNFSRLVSDIMTDAKIGAGLKLQYPVVDSEAGILGVLGLRRSNLAPVTEKTRSALSIKWQEANNG